MRLALILLIFRVLNISWAGTDELKCSQKLINAFSPQNDWSVISSEELYEKIKLFDGGLDFQKKQSESLKKNLRARGFECGSLDGFVCLKQLSKSNMSRILNGYSPKPFLTNNESIDLFDLIQLSFQMEFIHNSHELNWKTNIPIVSSKQLANFGLKAGRNTGEFCETILQGNDQVYFFAKRKLSSRNIDYTNKKSTYGSRVCSPDRVYGEQFGWISPFVMYPDDLGLFMFKAFGKRIFPDGTYDTYSAKLLKKMAMKLHLYDFTVLDFEELMNTISFKRLLEIKNRDPARFEKIVEEMRSRVNSGSNRHKFIDAFLREVESQLSAQKDFTLNFEFKIPVAIPVGKFKVW